MLIGLIGKRTSTARAGQFLKDVHGFDLFMFQTKLKLLCGLAFHLDPNMFNEPQCDQPLPSLGRTPLDLLFQFDCALRQIKPDVFAEDLRYNPYAPTKVVVPDVHFDADVDRIRALGGCVIRLREKKSPMYRQVALPLVSDFVIEFDENNDDLERECERVLTMFQKRRLQAQEKEMQRIRELQMKD